MVIERHIQRRLGTNSVSRPSFWPESLADSASDMESRCRTLFCQGCGDFVYDYGLERLRSSTPESTLKRLNTILLEFSPKAKTYLVTQKRRFSESSTDELYVRSNANKRPCAKQGVRGLFNLGQTCYLNVILQTLLHDPILNTYFLGNGHQSHDCTTSDCIGCAVAEAFAEFNSSEKAEGFAALSLLLASWRASSVGNPVFKGKRHE
jgi:ubiquitin carboxyl-terminal hydrolase 22/27/51